MRTAAIVVAAGRGLRAGGGLPKQWRALAGKPIAAHALGAFRTVGFDSLVLVHHPDDRAEAEAIAGGALLVEGGATRAESVRAALEALDGAGIDRVLIHDAARPLVSPALIGRVLAALDTHDAAAPGLPVTDALWRAAGDTVSGTQDREGLFAAQTPQGFRYALILAAHRAHPGGAADDVEVARRAGHVVAVVPGEADNIKITAPADFARAERLLGGAMDIRTGSGFDVHAFGPGDHVMLCGVRVPHRAGLVGHSDADVGMHALTDAIYGALAEGDIGRHFPPSDPQWKGAPSEVFLSHAAARARDRGFGVSNCDVTLICEHPKIGPHALAMEGKLAAILGIGADRVSVKATTSERLGFTGREEGIAALASVTLVAP
ncbi:MAG: bifunctional 2-C-methyl-D-erythritol 4-phosphate cytidylyltransferase/2-C-methyl-D-erythritol 2,4-cyclodiphosphate synthase [Rhodobacteraceae bacterium]|nr:bifunctional 2-C-methyl-D-erythritol 4-phosphate cytidylyltransferase/2-C-methyl-D-erythritol 2,4-cyclodiphosphate synthase [Paracoccaceae bacterium]